LHFGQISPIEVARKVKAAKSGSEADAEAFLEELIVRRELAINFVTFHPDYDSFKCLPDWARKTLLKHKSDTRPVRYTRAELERADTQDPYWNAAMREMLEAGYMHNHMRMYWGKKILEWCKTPEYAFQTALYLNNKYFIDGRDPNSYANVAWLFGLHDRPWRERAIFGTVRAMTARGLERKFDIKSYVRWVESLRSAE
jgi:deoxyribodipyrimidine photo-lyase